MRKQRLSSFLEFLGPGGFATPDDVEMLEQCQKGYQNEKEAAWNDVSRGMLKADPETIDEHQIRVFWRRWHERVQAHPSSPIAQTHEAPQPVPSTTQAAS